MSEIPENTSPITKTYAKRKKSSGVTITEPAQVEPPQKLQKRSAERPKVPPKKALENPKKLSTRRKGKEVQRESSPSSLSFSLSDADSDTPAQEEEPTSQPPSKIALPDQLMRWFSNKKQAKVFSDKFLGKSVKPLKYLDFTELKKTNLECFKKFEDQGVRDFLETEGDIYPDLVKVFYCNLSFSHNLIKSNVKETAIRIPLSQFSEIFKLNNCADGLSVEKPTLDKATALEFFNSLIRPDQSRRSENQVLTTGPLNADDRVMHYMLTYVLQPRGHNHAVITESDILLMYQIKNGIKIDWAEEICYHMVKCRSYSSLPYGYQVSHLLRIFKVDVTGEVVVKPKSHSALIEKQYLQTKLNMHWDKDKESYDFIPYGLKPSVARAKPSRRVEEGNQDSADTAKLLEKLDQQEKQITDLTELVKGLKEDLAAERASNKSFRTACSVKIDKLGHLLYFFTEAFEANTKSAIISRSSAFPMQQKHDAAQAADDSLTKLQKAKRVFKGEPSKSPPTFSKTGSEPTPQASESPAPSPAQPQLRMKTTVPLKTSTPTSTSTPVPVPLFDALPGSRPVPVPISVEYPATSGPADTQAAPVSADPSVDKGAST